MRGTPLVATFIIIIALGLGGSRTHAQNSSPSFAPVAQLVVLKNGEILRGQVTRNVEQVFVVTAQGSRLVLRAERTDFVCNSMDEAYWGKCARVKASDTAGQKKLFHWCIKNNMLTYAQNQIDILLQSDIKATELEYLDRQLNVAVLQQNNIRQRIAQQTAPTQTTTNIELDNSIGSGDLVLRPIDTTVFNPLPAFNGAPTVDIARSEFTSLPPGLVEPSVNDAQSIRQVGFEESLEFETISLDHKLPSNSIAVPDPQAPQAPDDRIMTSIAALERETRSMPEGSIGHYRQRVERVLTNGCSAAKCHDANSGVMPLLQLNRTQAIPRRQSQRNLHNILKYVDRTHPFESALLAAATTPHAGLEKPILTAGSPHYENLKLWLIQLSDNPRAAALDAIRMANLENQHQEPQDKSGTHPVAAEPVQPEPAGTNPVGAKPIGQSANAFPRTIGEIPKLESQDIGFTPLDPFDPEIFNRRFGASDSADEQ